MRLRLHLELFGHRKQLGQQPRHGNIRQGLAKHRLAHLPRRLLEGVQIGVRRHKTRLQMHPRHFAIVAGEEAVQQIGQIAPRTSRELRGDAEIHHHHGAVLLHQNVARVLVGVEIAVVEHLFKEGGEQRLRHRSANGVITVRVGRQFAEFDPFHPAHGEDLLPAQATDHLREANAIGTVLEVAPQLRAVARFDLEIKLIADGLGELLHHLHRLEATPLGHHPFGHGRQHRQHADIILHLPIDVGAHHFHRHLAAILGHRMMHLSDGGGGHRLGIEAGVERLQWRAQLQRHGFAHLIKPKRRHRVLQAFELLPHIVGQHVQAGGEHLPEFDEGGPQLLDGQTQPRRLGGAFDVATKTRMQLDQPAPDAHQGIAMRQRRHHIVARQNVGNDRHPPQRAGRVQPGVDHDDADPA
ncbi:hypothetical protein MAIT1_05315 [Magnetofaba australis IT-1]|uniref:Uncharacterized protein n=1 Tax=Magnetofaba australis IT-1 TaxID=1434232 RepID=A0A1Y2K0J9_9PROT|nr:hypothetical protein MAIT1_05315 [Magnetofaba australis IT-1]